MFYENNIFLQNLLNKIDIVLIFMKDCVILTI